MSGSSVGPGPTLHGRSHGSIPAAYRRKLNLKAKFESGSLYLKFKSMFQAFNMDSSDQPAPPHRGRAADGPRVPLWVHPLAGASVDIESKS